VTLPSETQILIKREFDLPLDVVYKTWTTPELVERWWHANRGEVRLIEIDLRPGGHWRYVMGLPDGTESAFHGEYREVVPGERIVSTEIYEGMPDAVALSTETFAEAGEGSVVTILVEHTSKRHRDVQLITGMEDGLQEAMDLLEQVASSLR
jgi:uncharacterized protein YndB with AHSA1/START domain